MSRGELAIRPASLLLDPDVVGDTVWLRDILCTWGASDITSPLDWGLRAWAIAKGPAHFGRNGTATLAKTKLASTVTGRTFSFIFSSLTGSANPKTIC